MAKYSIYIDVDKRDNNFYPECNSFLMADSDSVLFLDQSCRLTRWRWRFTLVGEGIFGGIYIDGETPPLDWGRSDESKRKSLQYLNIEQTSTLVSPKKWPSSAQTSVMCNLKMAFVNKHYRLWDVKVGSFGVKLPPRGKTTWRMSIILSLEKHKLAGKVL